MKFTAFFTLLLVSYTSFAGTNLLDLIQGGKAKYSLAGCTAFIQAANHQTLVSNTLKTGIVKARNSRYFDEYYFHYTNAAILGQTLKSDMADRDAAQKEIIKNGGYSAILNYQMTYYDALSNVAGVGFYIAANPFSSHSYGDQQLALKVSPDANFFDLIKNKSIYDAALKEKTTQFPAFAGCNANLQFSLLMNENGIDLVHYNDESEWLVVFNEDIFTMSRMTYVGSISDTALIGKLVANGDGAAVIEYVRELNTGGKNIKISLDDFVKLIPGAQAVGGQNFITKLADSMKANWSDSLKLTFAKLVANRPAAEMQALMNDFASSGLIPQKTFLDLPVTGTSADFQKWIVTRIKASPAVATAWKTGYETNMVELLKKDLIDLDFVFSNAPAEFVKSKFYKGYNSFSFSKENIAGIISYMVEQDSSAFTALDKEARYVVFNDFLKNADAKDIPQFATTMEKLSYDSLSSYNFIARKPTQFGANGLAFIISYLKLKKDPTLLTDPIIALFTASPDQGLEMLTYLKQNQSSFQAAVAKFARAYITSLKIEDFTKVVNSSAAQLFSKDDSEYILSLLLKVEGGAPYIPVFMQAYSYSTSDMLKVFSASGTGIANSPSIALMKILKNDSSIWTSFIDIKNATGMVRILNMDRTHLAKQTFLIDEAQDVLLKDPATMPVLAAPLMAYLLKGSRVRSYYSQYSEQQKLIAGKRIREFNPGEAREFMSGIIFDQGMATSEFNNLISASSLSDLEDLMNNTSLVKFISDADFQKLVRKITALAKRIDIRNLLKSDVLTLNKSIILAFLLDRAQGTDNLDGLLDSQLKFDDLSDDDRTNFLNKFLAEFRIVSPLARTKLWTTMFRFAGVQKKVDLFVPGYKSMTADQTNQLLNSYVSAPDQIAKAIPLFKQNSLNFVEEIMDHDKVQSVTNVLSYIETNYPYREEYALHMMRTWDADVSTKDLQLTHMKNFVCKKVKKYHAMNEIFDRIQDKEEKKALKERKKMICPGLFD